MNKKGFSAEIVIIFVLAVFVLAVGILIASGGYNRIIHILDIVPSGNRSVPAFQGEEVIRYVISEDKVQYLEGNKWNSIGGGVILNDKKLDGEEIRQAFSEGYYYNNSGLRDSKDIVFARRGDFYEGLRPDIVPDLRVVALIVVKDSADYGMASVRLSLRSVRESNKNLYGSFIVTFDGRIFFSRKNSKGGFSVFEEEDVVDIYGEIVNGATEWRDEVLDNLISVSYIDDKGKGIKRTEEFEVEFIDDKLVVRLDEVV